MEDYLLINDVLDTACRNYIHLEGMDKTFWGIECSRIIHESIGILNKLIMTRALTVPQEYRTKLMIAQYTELLQTVAEYKARLALLEETFMFPPSPPSQFMR